MRAVGILKNYDTRKWTPTLIEVAINPAVNKNVRKSILEIPGWFTLCYQRPIIIDACDNILDRRNTPEE